MSDFDSQASALQAEHPDWDNLHRPGVYPVDLGELAHDLRQPLSTIESLAYYLEITSADDTVCRHLEQIRRMVKRANGILNHAVAA